MGMVLPYLEVLVGVDMGSAISPILFCLAMDPLLVQLNKIPSVIGVRAYMDDNQIWGRRSKYDLEWLREVQNVCDKYQPAGFRIGKHVCCKFVPLKDPLGLNAPNNSPGQAPEQGVASWSLAAQIALGNFPSAGIFEVPLTQITFQRITLVGIALGELAQGYQGPQRHSMPM